MNHPAPGLERHVAVITGGARGIGEAVVRRLVDNGARVASLDVDTLPEHEAEPGVLRVQCDITNEDSVSGAIGEVTEKLGPVGILVNNAGINASYDATTMDISEWDHVLNTDLRGSWLCTKYSLPTMIELGRGSIVNISSIHARMTLAGNFPYAAAKAGVEGLTRSLALEYGPAGVRVNAVAPGYTRTRLVQQWLDSHSNPAEAAVRVDEVHALKRIVETDEVAAVVCFLASDDASAITGASIPVDCGLSARFAT